jgi:hypothetical protein
MTDERTPPPDPDATTPDHDATPVAGPGATPTPGDLVQIVVSVDSAHMPILAEVVAELESAGMVVDQTLPVLGTIAGRVPQARLDEVGHVEGVAAIEPARSFQLPPPDSDVQ